MDVWTLISLLSCFTYIVLCVVAWQQAGRSNDNGKANRVFVIFLAVAAGWSFSAFMLHLNVFPDYSLFWNEMVTVALVGCLITYYHFIRVYTNRVDGAFLYFGYLMLGILAVLSFSGHIVEYSRVEDGVLEHSLGNSIYFIGIFSLVYIIAVILHLIERYRTVTDPVDRNRTVYLICGWSVLVILTYTNLIPLLAPFPLDHLGNLFNALIIAYVISRFHLLDIKFVFRWGLTYTVLIFTLITIYLGAVYFFYTFMAKRTELGAVAGATVFALLLTLLARPLEHLIRRNVDRAFYRDTYDYRQTLFSFQSKMGNILNLEEVANEILPAITKALRITQTQLLFQDIASGDFVTHYTYPETTSPETKRELKLTVDNPIVVWLENRNMPLAIDFINSIPELKSLWQSEKDQLNRIDVGLLCPIGNHGKLIGILALGKKVKNTVYTHEDIEVVRNMASRAGIIVDNAQAYKRATQLANTDWLTGLYNHRSFHEQIEEEIARSSRFGAVFSLIMLDIDMFKSYNDTCGHLAGDEALRTIAKIIRGSIRSADQAFRYGGEEFTVILPGTRLEDSVKSAERIRYAIETRTKSLALPITISLGIASWPLDGVMKEEIIGRADAALYRAKQSGRNQIRTSFEIRNQPQLVNAALENRTRAIETVYALAATVEARDHYTYGHSRRVSEIGAALAESIGLPPNRVSSLRTAGLLHDIGKVGIPDFILMKREPLIPSEWEYIKAHPRVAVEILRHVPDLAGSLSAVLYHHERFDGTGYPSGLRGEAIPIEARILAIVDAYEAMTAQRSYRTEPARTDVIQELQRCSGTQFDPHLVTIFIHLLDESGFRLIKPSEIQP